MRCVVREKEPLVACGAQAAGECETVLGLGFRVYPLGTLTLNPKPCEWHDSQRRVAEMRCSDFACLGRE